MSPLLRDAGWIILYPLACVWAGMTRLRRFVSRRRIVYQPGRKTLIVGNLHSGGSGKTPIVAAITEHFSALAPVIVSRGYRAALTDEGALVERRAALGHRAFGDEPWMLANRLKSPVYIGRNRPAILSRAERETQGKVFILDDAFQNFSFRHDIDLVAIQADRGLGESDCIPLGDLREPLSSLRSASAVVLVAGSQGENVPVWRDFLKRTFPALPVFEAQVNVEGIWGVDGPVKVGTSLQWGAFCGIARPAAFHSALKKAVLPKFLESFPDHHAYEAEDIERLFKLKSAHDTHHFVTTEKDWYKALPLFEHRSAALFYLRIGYGFSDDFWYFLRTRLETA